MKIAFVIASLRGGGAERVASTLCNYWAENGHQIVMITFDDAQNDFYKSHESILRYGLGSNKTQANIFKKIHSNLQRCVGIRSIIKQQKPDVVVSFMPVPNMQAIMACVFTGIPVVVSERIYPPYFNDHNLFDRVRKALYGLSNAFVAQTNQIAQWGAEFLVNKKIAVIVNPLDTKSLSNDIEAVRSNTILAMGRLSTDKGFDMLLKAFKQVSELHPDWRLQIVGEGQERGNLEHQLMDLNLHDKVQLVGHTDSPKTYYASAKIFALSSRVEGFPNVLIEAMANGLAVVSFDCNSGPADIITDGINGLLVPANQVDAMAVALQRLIADSELRDRLSVEAQKVRDKYRVDVVSAQWFAVFDSL